VGHLTVGVPGTLELSISGAPVPVAGAKQRAVLAVLALNANRLVAVGNVVDAVWGAAGDTSEHTLQQHVSALRKIVDPDRDPGSASGVLVTKSPGYMLRVDESDVESFERDASGGFAAADAITAAQVRLPDGQVVALVEGFTLIGRSPEAQIRLIDSRVSRRHAQIESSNGCHLVRDLDSTNGTTVNGQGVTNRRLVPGDVVGVGGVELVFTADESETVDR
jgi:DNA-binding winged helix-turn-helix (wHTH) protein